MSDPIDVTKLTTPALHAKIDEARKQATEIVDGFKSKVQPDQHWSQVAEPQDVDRVKRLHGDVQILQQEINRRTELDGMAGEFEKQAKAATQIATMPMGQPAVETPSFGPLTPGQAFVMSDAYQKAQSGGEFKKSVSSQPYGMFPQFGVKLGFGNSWPMHRRLLQLAAKQHPEFFTKGTAINTDAASGGGFILPDFDLAPEALARQSLDVIGLLRVQPTTSNLITWLRQDTRITGATTVAEYTDTADTVSGKPEGGATWSQVETPVRTIAVHVGVTNQQLDDAPEIRGVIDEDLRFEIEEELNSQVLTGDGLGTNLDGIVPNAGNTVAFTGAGVSHDNVIDALLAAWVEVMVDNEAAPTGCLLNPVDWYIARTVKASGTGDYLMGPPSQAGMPTVWNIPVIPTNNMTLHTGLMGNFQAARLHVREDALVRVGYAHNDFLANRVRLLAELRACVTIRRPNAFCTVTGLDS